MKIVDTPLVGVKILRPKRIEDQRGYFTETWNRRSLTAFGVDVEFVQDNQSYSRHKGTVRGLHFQLPPHAQDKLVRVVVGKIWDVAVDIRKGSSTYGCWTGCELSAKNGWQLYIPKGFMHGFATLEANTEIVYKCSDYYVPSSECVVRYDDPTIGINWKISDSEAILSLKDSSAPLLIDIDNPFQIND